MVNRIMKRMAVLLARRLSPKLKPHVVPVTSIHTDPAVDMVTTWNQRCGIAAYSSFLVDELKRDIDIRVVEVSDNHVMSPYYLVLGYRTGKSPRIIHVQFVYAMFGSLPLGRTKSLSAFTALLFYLGLAMSNNKVVTTFHEVMPTFHAGGRIGLTYVKLLNRLVCLTSDVIVVHNRKSKEIMQKTYRAPESKIRIIPMGIYENPVFLDRERCKAELRLSGKTILTLPGFVSRRKNLELVVKVLPLLDRNVQLLIAGGPRTKDDALYAEELMALAKQNNCFDRITFENSFPIPDSVMNATDIAILPYGQATESMMLRHLVAYRVPTLTSDIDVFKELKSEFDCVELFETGSQADLLRKLTELMADERRQDCLRQQCGRMWNATRWRAVAAKHFDLYLEVMAAHPEAVYDDPKQKERLEWLKTNVAGRVLEVGCATGYVTNYVGAEVGLDLNQFRVRVAKKKYRDKDFVVASAEFLPFRNGGLEMVLIPEMLEHVPLVLAEKIVAEAKRAASQILITLPNAEKANYDKAIVENPEHRWFPTRDLVSKIVKNLAIEYTKDKDFILVRG